MSHLQLIYLCERSDTMKETKITALYISLFKENNIIIDLDRDRKNRTITMTRQGEQEQTERDG